MVTRRRLIRVVVWHAGAPLTCCARTPRLAARTLARALAALTE